MTVTGRDAPPEVALRSGGRRASLAAASSRPMYIVGTPWNSVTPCASISSSAPAPSNLGIITTVAPVKNDAFITQVWPNEWNSGSTARTTSSTEISMMLVAESWAFISMLRCDITAPLGWPVVPEV
ncbi:MAG: hypothetical protein QOD91_2639 [Frankiales bacterium]|nr:hypothetical protein [Frankiales bacterium]